jgi:NAD-dependent SIR2 family protein deacetylase
MEYEDTSNVLEKKFQQLIELVKNSQYLVAFTGAGISTAAGIPDFRGPKGQDVVGWQSSVLGMGVGQGVMDVWMPTYAHVALTKLAEVGILKHIVSSNHDNFHIRAGSHPDMVTEIFGNSYIETCLSCQAKYLRHTQVPQLGRICDDPSCGGRLKKEGVRFNAIVPQEPLKKATKQAKKADLALVLGSSMSVSPFCDLPGKANKVVLCCLQDTSYDSKATLKINSTCDKLMKRLMDGLGIEVGDYIYRQAYSLCHKQVPTEMNKRKFWLQSGYRNEICTCVESVAVQVNSHDHEIELEENNGLFETVLDLTHTTEDEVKLNVKIEWRRGYSAPTFETTYIINKKQAEGKEDREFAKVVHYPINDITA